MLETKSDYKTVDVGNVSIDGNIFPNNYPNQKTFPLSRQNMLAMNEAMRQREQAALGVFGTKASIDFEYGLLNIKEKSHGEHEDNHWWWDDAFRLVLAAFRQSSQLWLDPEYGFGQRTERGAYQITDFDHFFGDDKYLKESQSELRKLIDYEDSQATISSPCLNLLEPVWRDMAKLNRLQGDRCGLICVYGDGTIKTSKRKDLQTGETSTTTADYSGYLVTQPSYQHYTRSDIEYDDRISCPNIDILSHAQYSPQYIDTIHLYPVWNASYYTKQQGSSGISDFDTASLVGRYDTKQSHYYSGSQTTEEYYAKWTYDGGVFSGGYGETIASRFAMRSDALVVFRQLSESLICSLNFPTDIKCFN